MRIFLGGWCLVQQGGPASVSDSGDSVIHLKSLFSQKSGVLNCLLWTLASFCTETLGTKWQLQSVLPTGKLEQYHWRDEKPFHLSLPLLPSLSLSLSVSLSLSLNSYPFIRISSASSTLTLSKDPVISVLFNLQSPWERKEGFLGGLNSLSLSLSFPLSFPPSYLSGVL